MDLSKAKFIMLWSFCEPPHADRICHSAYANTRGFDLAQFAAEPSAVLCSHERRPAAASVESPEVPPRVPPPSPADIRRQLKAWEAPEAGRLRLAAALGIADVACVAGFAWGLSDTVTRLWQHAPAIGLIAWPMAAMGLSLAARAALNLFSQTLNQDIARRVIRHIRRDAAGRALSGTTGAGALYSLFEDTEALEGYYARFRQAGAQAAVAPLVLVALTAVESPVSAGLLVLSLVPFAGLMALLGLSSAAEAKRQLDALSRLSNLFVDRIRTLPLILAFNDGRRQAGIVARAASDVAERTLSVLKLAFVTSAVLEFFSALSVAMIAVYCGFSLLGELPFRVPEHLTLGAAFFVLALSPEVYAPMRRLSAAYHDRQTAVAAAGRLMSLPAQAARPEPMAIAAAPLIVFDSVATGFGDDPDFRIGPVSFAARPGTVTALTGPTGAGKTTLLRLLLGDGCVLEGQVTVDGHPLGDMGAGLGWVSQSPPILTGTLRDNLLLANPHAGDAEIARAVDITGLGPLVAARGLDAQLDDRGSGLSGGERKRIGLARALLKDAPVLLLDEPTADLDAAAEAELLAILPAVFKGRTVILSSHSPALVALANQEVRIA
jgi:ATP-binding cassette subfamily C protein CydD